MNKKLKDRIDSFKYAFQGFFYLISSQPNSRIHLAATIIVYIFGWLFSLHPIEWIAISIVIAMVWITELINTAIENAVNLASSEIHPLAKIAKDTGAAAVLTAAICSVIVGLIVFLPRLINLVERLF